MTSRMPCRLPVSPLGFELVHQSVCLHPHWQVRGDAQGRWTVTLILNANTALAESRMRPQEAVATV